MGTARRPATDHDHDHEPEEHDLGLQHDLATLMTRRRALALAAVGGLVALVGCGGSSDSSATTAAPATTGSGGGATAGTTASVAEEIPEETAGPFPGDGSNGPDVLSESGVVREDLTRSFGTGSGVAEGVPLTLALTVLDVSEGAAPVAGAAVYAWHCDREGRYSLYSPGVEGENYLRGVQVADEAGRVTFRTVFPGAYPGRWPHVHFEVYPDLASATSRGSKLVTSQLAFPEDACRAAYATSGYATSLANLSAMSLETDMIFADGYSAQLARMSGDPGNGMTASLVVGV